MVERSGGRHLVRNGDDSLEHSEDEGSRHELQKRPRAATPQTSAHHLWADVLSKVNKLVYFGSINNTIKSTENEGCR